MKRLFADPETDLAVKGAWTIGLLFFTLAGYYMGNIISVPPPHDRDLMMPDIMHSLTFGLMGLALGIIFAAIFTAIYPRLTREDLAHDIERYRHPLLHGHAHGAHDPAPAHSIATSEIAETTTLDRDGFAGDQSGSEQVHSQP